MRTAKINEIVNKGEKELIKAIQVYPDWPQQRRHKLSTWGNATNNSILIN